MSGRSHLTGRLHATRADTQSHVDYVIEVCSAVAERRAESRGLRMILEPPTLRHFTARFEFVG